MSGYRIGLHRPSGDRQPILMVQGVCDSAPRSYPLPEDAAERLFKLACELRVPAAPHTAMMGIDGGTHELSFIAGMRRSTFSWWVEPPEGWEPLQALADEVIELASGGAPPEIFTVVGF